MQPATDDRLPQSDSDSNEGIDGFLKRAPAMMISMIVHLLVLICLAICSYRIPIDEPFVVTVAQADDQPDSFEITPLDIEVEVNEPEEVVEQVVSVPLQIDQPIGVQDSVVAPKPAMGRLASGMMKGYSVSFASRITDAKEHGIDIVIVLDSTGSMRPEIQAVKTRIRQIVEAVLDKIPKARFSLVTYRDRNEQFVVRGIRLTQSTSKIQSFVDQIAAGGGGDHPEAVDAGMYWATRENKYSLATQKVMLIFGDAPPHRSNLNTCIKLAEQFRGYGKGRVLTITCRKPSPLPEFYSIARAGGGEPYVMRDANRLMEDVLVVAFGAENRDQVLNFFDLKKRTLKRQNSRSRGRPGPRS